MLTRKLIGNQDAHALSGRSPVGYAGGPQTLQRRCPLPIESFEAFTPRIHLQAFVHPQATLIGDVEIGEEATIWPGVVLRGDSGRISIGARTSIQDNSVAHGTHGISETRIGVECTVGHRVVLHGCVVGDRCVVGMGSVVMDNVEIGEGSFVAAGSLVPPNKIFPPRSFIIGTPAKRLRDVSEDEARYMELGWRSYQDLCHRYRAR